MPDRNAPDRQKRRPTIKDVAERAHVSKSLVSLVLSDSSRVSDKSRTAILAAIEELGYRPSAVARSLVSGRTKTIGVIVSNEQDPSHPVAMEGIQTSASAAGLSPLIMHGRRTPEHETDAVETFMGLRVDAIIFIGSVLPTDQLNALGKQLPVAVTGRRMAAEAVDVIVADSRLGASLAVEHLIELGHHRIAHIDASLSEAEPQCLVGYRETMEAHNLDPNVVIGSLLQEGGESGARKLLEQKEFPTAIFAATDLAALGARDVIEKAGMPIPDRVSIVGYNDSPFARLHAIELTSIREPTKAMGIYAAEVVANRILDPEEPPAEWIAEPELVVRSSTAPPAA